MRKTCSLLVVLGMLTCWNSAFGADPSLAKDPLLREIETWLVQNSDDLPASLSEFIETPPLYRRAVFKILSPDIKSRLWREHFDLWASERNCQTKAQREFLDKLADLVSNEGIFTTSPSDPQWREEVANPVEEIRREAVRLFGLNHAAGLLENLGGQLAAPNVVISDNRGTVSIRKTCCCSTASDWCGTNNCYCGSGGCSPGGGCGTLLLFECNGTCFHYVDISQE